LPIVLLSKKIALVLEFGISAPQPPQALAGFSLASRLRCFFSFLRGLLHARPRFKTPSNAL
jgi:hypothetical protein